MAHKTAGQAMTELLEQWGVDHVYGIPGDSINEFIEELRHERNQLKFIQTRHEEVAALAAAAEAKLTGKIGVCLSMVYMMLKPTAPLCWRLQDRFLLAKSDGTISRRLSWSKCLRTWPCSTERYIARNHFRIS